MTLIGGLRTLQEGSIEVLGQELRGLSQKRLTGVRRNIGFIFQQHNLLRALSALQNVTIALQLSNLASREIDARARDMLARLGLQDRLHYKPDAMSGGQRQRVAIARALVNEPRVVLADEPTAALDKDSGQSVIGLLREIAKQKGAAIIVVTHDKRVIDRADRIVNLVDGQIVSDVAVEESLVICEFLMKGDPFATLTPAVLSHVADRMAKERYPAGKTVIQQGDVGDKFYIIRAGTADVLIEDGGASRWVRTLHEGDYFGEAALITGNPRSATVTAKEDVVLYALTKEDFRATLDRSASFQAQVREALFARQ
jgi:putative ABC transport system ATP-binding protein